MRKRFAFRSETTRHAMAAMVAFVLVLLWIMILWGARFQYYRLIDDAARELGKLNSAVAHQVDGLFGAADSALRTLDHWIATHPGRDPRIDRELGTLAEQLRESSRGLINLYLLTPDGDMVPLGSDASAARAAKRSFFTAQPAAGRRVMLGVPQASSATGRPVLPLSLPLSKPANGAAVLLAEIDLESLHAIHDELRIKPSGTITLVSAEGIILARTPSSDGLVGRNVAASPAYSTEYGAKERGWFVSDNSMTDGVARVISYQRAERHPVAVLVTQSVEQVHELYHTRRAIVFALAGLFTLVVAGFTLALYRSMHELQMSRIEVERLAAVDPLTGLMNRRSFLGAAEKELARARRYRRPCAVVMLDLDHFKRVNDVHGHSVGDEVLKRCAATWKDSAREQDLIGRLGGEEFCALLPETAEHRVTRMAERLRAATSQLSFAGREPFTVTVSIGTTSVGENDESLAQVIERADGALYRAKQLGRNRIEHAAPESDPPPAGRTAAA